MANGGKFLKLTKSKRIDSQKIHVKSFVTLY